MKKIMTQNNSRIFLADSVLENPIPFEDLQWTIAMSPTERLLYEGSVFFSYIDEEKGVGVYLFRFKTPPANNCMFQFILTTSLEGYITIYEDAVLSAAGTTIPAIARNRANVKTQEVIWERDATYSDMGTSFGPLPTVGDTTGSKSKVQDNIPLQGVLILKRDTEYVFELDIRNAATSVEMGLTWAERVITDDEAATKGAKDSGF